MHPIPSGRTIARGTMVALSLSIAALALSACGDSGPPGATGATGATGPAGAPGADLNWVEVTGSAAQASPNTGYLAESSSPVSITLPPSPAVGDIVEVSGAGSGGWQIAQNAGQQVYVGFENSLWTPIGPSENWVALTRSANGGLLAAAANGGAIYTSTDAGASWTAQNSGNNHWSFLAASADGTYLLASTSSGQLYVSSNSGQSWNAEGPSIEWGPVAISPDDLHMIAYGYDNSSSQEQIYASSDSGSTWTLQSTGNFVAAFAWPTPTELIASGQFNSASGLYLSSNEGTTWTLAQSSYYPFGQIATSSDGTQIYAVGAGSGMIVSRDSGASWTQNPASLWDEIATSPDGTALIVNGSLPVSISTDSGSNWTQLESSGENFSNFLVTGKDQRAIAAVYGGALYAVSEVSTAGTAGTVSGTQNQSVTLQYVGNGMFLVIGNEGHLAVQ